MRWEIIWALLDLSRLSPWQFAGAPSVSLADSIYHPTSLESFPTSDVMQVIEKAQQRLSHSLCCQKKSHCQTDSVQDCTTCAAFQFCFGNRFPACTGKPLMHYGKLPGGIHLFQQLPPHQRISIPTDLPLDDIGETRVIRSISHRQTSPQACIHKFV